MANIGFILHQRYQQEMIDCLAPYHKIKIWDSIESAVSDLKESIATVTAEQLALIIVPSEVETQRLTIFDLLKWIRRNSHYSKLPFLIVESRSSEVPSCVVSAVRQVGILFGATKHVALDAFNSRIFTQAVEECLKA
ncbi:hypothetical protein BH10CYA1_BH10CYA1_04320 [soil metagenome]